VMRAASAAVAGRVSSMGKVYGGERD